MKMNKNKEEAHDEQLLNHVIWIKIYRCLFGLKNNNSINMFMWTTTTLTTILLRTSFHVEIKDKNDVEKNDDDTTAKVYG